LAAIAVFVIVRPVDADPVTGDREFADSAMAVSGRVFSHVTTPGAKKNWAEKELNRLYMARRPRLNRVAVEGGFQGDRAPGGETVQGGPTMDSGAVAADGPPAEGDESVATSYLVGGGEGGEGFATGHDPDPIGSEFGGVSAEFVQEAIGDIPGLAFSVADALAAFTDSTMHLLLNLKTLFRDKTSGDWAQVLDQKGRKSALSGRRVSKNSDSRKKELEEEAARHKFKKAVRSAFKILLGLAVGWLLWQFVRRS
jgi:hypothetical protein